MSHINLIDNYKKGEKLYLKKNYRRARSIFRAIVSEIQCSDTDCIADFNLCESTKEYLSEIQNISY